MIKFIGKILKKLLPISWYLLLKKTYTKIFEKIKYRNYNLSKDLNYFNLTLKK